ncbi:MAG: hypothetical protein CVT62_01695 [Actinobacteria bacterium HGW-Actinobacteria-2]|nr:MAG: hypothetical protein CVT62_01695 [Actinobacteria bacterium HGW-Actinobacteria-2]
MLREPSRTGQSLLDLGQPQFAVPFDLVSGQFGGDDGFGEQLQGFGEVCGRDVQEQLARRVADRALDAGADGFQCLRESGAGMGEGAFVQTPLGDRGHAFEVLGFAAQRSVE